MGYPTVAHPRRCSAWLASNMSPWLSSLSPWTSSSSSSRHSGASNAALDRLPSRTPSPWKTWHPSRVIHTPGLHHITGLMTPMNCTLATVVCCWWMLRGIEVAASRLEHFWFETTPFGKMAFFTLPCHKTGAIGMCITRSHPCMCADGLSRLCPYRALEQFIIQTTTQRGTIGAEDCFLFPGANCGAITHEETIQVFRAAIEATGAQLTRPGPQGQLLQRFNEHVCRVSGAQFLTRLGYPVETAQLIGRWGSNAVKRYVQDTPFSCATGSTSARTTVNRIPAQKAIQGMVKKYRTPSPRRGSSSMRSSR